MVFQLCCLDIFNLFFEDFWLHILFVETSMQLKSGDINVILFPLTECRIFDHSRHEDIASSCTATKFNCVEDGRDFRGTSKGIVAIYHIAFVFL